MGDLRGRLDQFVGRRIEDILSWLNIPSRSDIERLNRSVDVLTRKVEALLAREAPTRDGSTRQPVAGPGARRG
jgi:polyhydroxyalkanoate synthesis regulator phasin